MRWAQLLAGSIAAALVILIIAASWRWRLRSTTVLFMLMFGLPALGFGFYAIRSGPNPNLDIIVALVILLYATGAMLIVAGLVRRIRRGRPTVWDMATDSRRYLIALIARWLQVLWFSSLLYLFEPGFAIATVALNVVWMIVWLPSRLRTSSRRVETDIAASPTRVFDFVSDVRNWRLYRDDVELVSLSPDGPLGEGSEYAARVAVPETMRRTSYRAFLFRYRVSGMVAGKSFDILLLDQVGRMRTEVEPSPLGARLSRTSETRMGLLRAWSADMLNNPPAEAAVRKREDNNHRRLKDILETAPAQ